MTDWLDQLRQDLQTRARGDQIRSLRAVDRCTRLVERDGRMLVNLASNDYLGLACHPRLRQAVIEAVEQYGVGAGSSPLVAGHLDVHRRAQERFAAFKRAPAALMTPTGYAANLATLTVLADHRDAILLDKLCHASLIDAARASGAQVRAYPHRNLDRLQRLLVRYRAARRRLIVTDSIFSMDGDCADLADLCQLRDSHSAILIVDDAHATGVLGARGAGLAQHQGVEGRIDVMISTAGKALGSMGGIITGPVEVIQTIVNGARTFIYSTAAGPAQAAAIEAALEVIESEPQRRRRLNELITTARTGLADLGWPVRGDPTPIIPLIVGDNAAALALSNRLESAGFLAPAIRPPTVAPRSARVRLSLRADLTENDLDQLLVAVGRPPATAIVSQTVGE